MKEATGELNMTVVIVVTVGFLAVFFFAVLWPSIKTTFIATSKCSDAICTCPNNDCKNIPQDSLVDCVYYKNGKQVGQSFKCPWKG